MHSQNEGIKMSEKDIKTIIASAQVWCPSSPSDRDLADLPRNDRGNALRLIRRRGGDLMWIEEIGWHVWTGTHWRRDQEAAAAIRIAFEVAEAIMDEAAALTADAEEVGGMSAKAIRALGKGKADADAIDLLDRADRHAGHSVMSGNTAKALAMLTAAAAYQARPARDLDRDPLLFNCKNGTIDMTGEQILLREHDRADMITKVADVEYDPEATCPRFRKFLSEILPSGDVASFVQVFFGYGITGRTSEQVMAVLWGTGANGKSTLLNVIAGTVGDYAMHAPVESFLFQDRKNGADASPDLARLPGSRIVLTSEPETGSRLSESRVKSVTGGEKLTVRRLHRDFFEFDPVFKLIFSCNIKPTIRGQDHGIWRRIMMIPFTVQIPVEKRHKELDAEILAEERPGVMNWLLDGFLIHREEGLKPPPEVAASTDDYRRESDPIGEFARWALVAGSGTIAAKRLYDLYASWCTTAAVDPVKQAFFGRRLGDLGYHKAKVGTVFYENVNLTDDADRFEFDRDHPNLPPVDDAPPGVDLPPD